MPQIRLGELTPEPIARFKGLTSTGRGRERRGEEERKKRKGGKGREKRGGEGKEREGRRRREEEREGMGTRHTNHS